MLDERLERRGPIWSTGVTAPGSGDVPSRGSTPPDGHEMPVRWATSGVREAQVDLHGGDSDVTGAGDGPGPIDGEPEPDAVARGWVIPPGGSRVDAIFVLAGTSLGIGRVERATTPVWLNLDDLVNLDAIGEPVDGLTHVEIVMDDDRVIGAGWTDDFCAAVVEVLRATAGRPTATPGSPAAVSAPTAPEQPTAPAVDADAAPVDPVPSPTDAVPVVAPPALAAPEVAAPAVAAPAQVDGATGAALELEDVVYLGGYPGHSKRRKKCVASMSRSAIELRGPGDLHFRIGWDVVRTIEVQNADEARFRMNTKIHRDASALVVECDQGVAVLLEARDCPTIALRSAITQLLDGLPVVVV